MRAELELGLYYSDEAEAASHRALVLAREMKLQEEEVKCLLIWGQALLASGRKGEGREAIGQARRLSQERDYEDHFNKAEELLRGVN